MSTHQSLPKPANAKKKSDILPIPAQSKSHPVIAQPKIESTRSNEEQLAQMRANREASERMGSTLLIPESVPHAPPPVQPKLTKGQQNDHNRQEADIQPQAAPIQSHPVIAQPKIESTRSNEEQLAQMRAKREASERLGTTLLTPESVARTRPQVQPKLTIGQPNDQYEQEADRVARQVVDHINAPPKIQAKTQRYPMSVGQRKPSPLAHHPVSRVQRQATGGEMDASPDLESSIQRARGGGQPLGDGIRESMEGAFGADFSGVRVHTDGTSDQLNQSIQAKAFTTGQDVFFRKGAYEPGSRGGQELLAHELTHVVQQSGTEKSVKRREKRNKYKTLKEGEEEASKDQEMLALEQQETHPAEPVLLSQKERTETIQRRLFVRGETQNLQNFLKQYNVEIQITDGQITKIATQSPEAEDYVQFFVNIIDKIMNAKSSENKIDTWISINEKNMNVTVGQYAAIQRINLNHIETIRKFDKITALASLLHEIYENFESAKKETEYGGPRAKNHRDRVTSANNVLESYNNKGERGKQQIYENLKKKKLQKNQKTDQENQKTDRENQKLERYKNAHKEAIIKENAMYNKAGQIERVTRVVKEGDERKIVFYKDGYFLQIIFDPPNLKGEIQIQKITKPKERTIGEVTFTYGQGGETANKDDVEKLNNLADEIREKKYPAIFKIRVNSKTGSEERIKEVKNILLEKEVTDKADDATMYIVEERKESLNNKIIIRALAPADDRNPDKTIENPSDPDRSTEKEKPKYSAAENVTEKEEKKSEANAKENKYESC